MRWLCRCAYDGTNFEGWQSQSSGNTVQDIIEQRLAAIFKKSIRIHGSGRTDAGVHANGQCFHFDGEWLHGPEKLIKAIGTGLMPEIQILSAEVVPDTFHARFSVKKKRYIYHYFLGKASPFEYRYWWSIGEKFVDVRRMNILAEELIGEHNFSAFGASRGDGNVVNPVKTLYQLKFEQKGKNLKLITEGSGYLYKMVRTLATTFLDVGLHRLDPDYVLDCFREKVRRERIVTAPPQGLFLDEVFYK